MVVLMMFLLALVLGCSTKEASDDMTKEPAGTPEAESMDTTSMDSAMMMEDTSMVEDTTM